MALVTLRVLSGSDRGKVYSNLKTPITIGREDGNPVQLNDDRISRFHVKIQEDAGKLVLTDLDSTNGTKVNGEDIQLRILRYGDIIVVGKSVLLYGTRKQIAARLAELRMKGVGETDEIDLDELAAKLDSASFDFDEHWEENEALHNTLHMPTPPNLPTHLSPGQAAEVSELIEYFHGRMKRLLLAVHVDEEATSIQLKAHHWQSLAETVAQLSEYLNKIGSPEE